MDVKFLDRSFIQRMLGKPATEPPENPGCWKYAAGRVVVDLDKAPELAKPGGALRLEKGGLPARLLIVRGEDGTYHAIRNRCSHVGHRRLDPVPGTSTVQCCSVNKSTFTLDGKNLYGPGKSSLATYPVTQEGNTLVVEMG